MKILKLSISVEGLELKNETKNPIELATKVIKNVILIWGNQKQRGLNEEDRRKFYKISDLFDKAAKENMETVEVEDDWMGMIKKSFMEALLTPDELLRRVEENVFDVRNR
jgi:hypothetical protein